MPSSLAACLLPACLQGWEDLDLPLVRELRGHVDREDAWEAKHAFEAALAPLKEALQRVRIACA